MGKAVNKFCILSFIIIQTVTSLLCCSSLFAAENTFNIVTSEFPPYSYRKEGKQKGYATELVKAAFTELDIEPNIESFPYKRAQIQTIKYKNMLLYPLARTAENEHQYHWISKITDRRIAFFKHKSNLKLKINSLSEATKYRIGSLIGSTISKKLTAEGVSNLDEVYDNIFNLRKLAAGKVDLIATEELVLAHSVENYNKSVSKQKTINLSDYVKVFDIPLMANEKGLFVAMGKKNPIAVVNKIKTAFEAVKRKGEIVEVAHWWTNKVEEKMLTVYRKALADSGYKWVDYTFEGGAGSNMKQLLEVRDEANNRPNAFQTYMGPALWEWAQKDVLVCLDEVAMQQNWNAILPDIIRNKIQYKGSYVAVPVNIQRVNWVWANPSVFKQANTQIPRTWKEFYSAAELIKQAGFIPVSIGLEPWQEGTLFENIALGVGGAEFYKKAFIDLDIKTLNGPEMINVFKHFRKIRGFIDKNAAGRSWVEAAKLVADGKAAMYFMGDWAKGVFKSAGLKYGNGYISFPTPGTDQIFLNNTDVFAFPKIDVYQIPGQMALAKVIMDKEVQKQFNIEKGSIPARLDISPDGFDDVQQISMKAVHSAQVIPSFNFRQTAPEQIHEAFVSIISQFFNSYMTPQEAVKQLSQKVKELK